MSSINYVDNSTLIPASWLNDVNSVTYTLFGDGSSYSGNPSFIATQSDQTTGTTTTKVVTSGRQQYHSSAAKFWILCDSSGNITNSYNVTSITDTGTGEVAITINVDFSSANYVVSASIETTNVLTARVKSSSRSAGAVSIQVFNATPVAADPDFYHIVGYGFSV